MASVTPDPNYNLAAYVRVTSLAIAFYDYLETAPTAYKFYKAQWQERRCPGISSVLFGLIRMTSILVLVFSNVGYFAQFTEASCSRYYLLAPGFKVVQGMVSHLILAVRAYNVSNRSKFIGYFMGCFYILIIALQWIVTIGHRKVEVTAYLSCKATPEVSGTIFSAWIYYVLAIAFDAAATAVTMYYCIKQMHQRKSKSDRLSRVVRIMLRDGFGYLMVLTLSNALNAVFFYNRTKNLQTAFASLGYATTWIFSQRLIIHLYWVSIQQRSGQIMTSTGNGLLTVTHALTTNHSIANALRSQHYSRKQDGGFADLTVPELALDLEAPRQSTDTRGPQDDENQVEVRVERTVRIAAPKRFRYELEDYSRRPSSSRDGHGHWS